MQNAENNEFNLPWISFNIVLELNVVDVCVNVDSDTGAEVNVVVSSVGVYVANDAGAEVDVDVNDVVVGSGVGMNGASSGRCDVCGTKLEIDIRAEVNEVCE